MGKNRGGGRGVGGYSKAQHEHDFAFEFHAYHTSREESESCLINYYQRHAISAPAPRS